MVSLRVDIVQPVLVVFASALRIGRHEEHLLDAACFASLVLPEGGILRFKGGLATPELLSTRTPEEHEEARALFESPCRYVTSANSREELRLPSELPEVRRGLLVGVGARRSLTPQEPESPSPAAPTWASRAS